MRGDFRIGFSCAFNGKGKIESDIRLFSRTNNDYFLRLDASIFDSFEKPMFDGRIDFQTIDDQK